MARPTDPSKGGPYVNVQGEQAPAPFRNVGFAGSASGSFLPPSINPPMPSSPVAIAQEQQRISQQTLMQAERLASFMATAADKAEILARSMDARGIGGPSVPAALSSKGIGGSSEQQIAAAHARSEQARTTNPYGESVASAGHPGATTTQMAGGIPQPAWKTATSNYGLHDLRADAARSVGRRISGWQAGPNLTADDQGRFHYASGEQDSEGNKIGGRLANAAQASRFVRNQKITGGIKNFVGGIAEGEGPMAALQGTLGEIAPMAGMALGGATAAIGVAKEVKDFATNQRNVNAGWQQTLGGSNAEGFGERARSQMFEWSHSLFGGIGAGQASELYRGAANIYGTDRGARDQAQEFGLKAWKSMGLEVKDSLALIAEEAKHGNTELTNLASSLQSVTKSAREAGINAQAARAMFTQNLTAANQVVGGAAAPVIASGLAQMQVGLGKQFGDADFSGLFTQGSINQQAYLSGQSRPDYLLAIQQDPGKAGAGTTKQIQNVATQILGQAAVQFIISEIGKLPTVHDADWKRVAGQVQHMIQRDGFSIAPAIQALLGITVAPDTAIEFLCRAFDQTNTAEKFIKDAADASKTKPVSLGGQSYGKSLQDDKGALGKIGKRVGLKDVQRDILGMDTGGMQSAASMFEKAGGDFDKAGIGNMEASAGLGDDQRLAFEYTLQAGHSGKTNPIIEALLKGGGAHKYKWEVDTKDGKRTVSTESLIRNYSDQAAAGTAVVKEAPNKESIGKTIAEQEGMVGDKSVKVTSDDKSPHKGDKESKADKGESGHVTVEPTPFLLKILNFQGTGNAYVAGSQYSGTPSPGAVPVGPSTTPSG